MSTSTLPQVNVGVAHSASTQGVNNATFSYTAPWGGFGSGNAIFVRPQGKCGYIGATPAAGFSWPSFLNSLSAGTTVTVSGIASFANASDQAAGCPTGGIVASSVVIGKAAPTPAPSPTPTPTPAPTPTPHPTATPAAAYHYTAPWGGFGSSPSIYLDPQGPCGHIPASPASGYSWPAFLSGLASGTVVTMTGTPSYADNWAVTNNCPTGGIVVTSIVIGTAAPKSSPTPAPVPTAAPKSSPTPAPVGGACNLAALTNNASWPAACQFNTNSTWHQQLSNVTPAQYAANDSTAISEQFVYASGNGTLQSNRGFAPIDSVRRPGYPEYVCQAGQADCVKVTLNCQDCSGGLLPAGQSLNGTQFYIPKYAYAELNSDQHLSVLDNETNPGHPREWLLYGWPGSAAPTPPSGGFVNGQTYTIPTAGYTDPVNGSGWGDSVYGTGVTVAGATMLPGMIRTSEIANGINGIQHAISFAVACSTASPVYPATLPASYTCGHFGGNDNNDISPGARVYWDESCPTIANRTALDAWSKAVLCALHTYGAYMDDTTGYNAMDIGDHTEMQFVTGGTDLPDFVLPAYKAYATNSGYTQDGSEVYFPNGFDNVNSANGPLPLSEIEAHLHLLKPCVNTGSC